MSIQKLPLLLAALTLSGAFATITVDAEARERTRSRTAGNVDGVRSAAVNASGSGTNGSYARGRQWQADGQGNASGSSGGTVDGVNGGSASRQGGFYRNADGSAGRQGSASVNGANGGSASTSGGVTRDANGNVVGGRSTTATGQNGNSYDGSTTVSDGTVTHTGTCTNAAGEEIACRGGD